MRLAEAVVLGVCAFAPPALADVSIVDNNKTVEVDCAKDAEISLVGNHLTLKTKGVCARISISGNHETVTGSARTINVFGNHNIVTLDAADDVTVAGNRNTVTVRHAVKLEAPRITNSGSDNKITQPK